MNRAGKTYALLASARIANLPSVVSNVWVGTALGMVWSGEIDAAIPWSLAVAGIFLYLAGNFLNDWMDRDWDAKHRPERALPNKVFPPKLYLILAIILSIAACFITYRINYRCGFIASTIIILIIVYTIYHKRIPWAVIPMGLCRGLLPVMGFFVFCPYINSIWPIACALSFYIIGLSLTARYEAMAAPPRWVALIARYFLLIPALFIAWGNKTMFLGWWPSVLIALPYLAWTSFSLRCRGKSIPVLVSNLLAGIPLVDWMVLFPLGIMLGSVEPLGVLCLVLPPVAFVFSLVLRRLAPAT